ncbi:outer membrane beta-barrel protein [Vibrio mediterranei]|uniref:outer membrane beta-barrel protein n=1 Tax=Vibrio mediterranei TaxID=689 RepID=UPI001EFCBC0D|nr:outer membrane beta-barrel protein [Vibrio mediterranei]MCG9657166.1 hypothetical protein [Vibrio mediterranei]
MKPFAVALPLTLLLASTTASAHSFQFNAGVDTNKSFAFGIEGLVYSNFLLGAQANLGSTDEYNSGPYNHPDISNATYTQKRSLQSYSLYAGYQLDTTMLKGLAFKAGVSQIRANFNADVYGTENGNATSEVLYDMTKTKYTPFVGLGYPVSDNIVLSVHATFDGIDTIVVDGKSEPSGFDKTTVSFLAGFRF